MNKWIIVGEEISISPIGENTIRLENEEYPKFSIEIKKRVIPFYPQEEVWTRTYYVVTRGLEQKEYCSIEEAIKAVETWNKKGRW